MTIMAGALLVLNAIPLFITNSAVSSFTDQFNTVVSQMTRNYEDTNACFDQVSQISITDFKGSLDEISASAETVSSLVGWNMAFFFIYAIVVGYVAYNGYKSGFEGPDESKNDDKNDDDY